MWVLTVDSSSIKIGYFRFLIISFSIWYKSQGRKSCGLGEGKGGGIVPHPHNDQKTRIRSLRVQAGGSAVAISKTAGLQVWVWEGGREKRAPRWDFLFNLLFLMLCCVQANWQRPLSRSTSAPPASTSSSPRSPSTVATPIAGSAWPGGGGNIQLMEWNNRELDCPKRKRALAS